LVSGPSPAESNGEAAAGNAKILIGNDNYIERRIKPLQFYVFFGYMLEYGYYYHQFYVNFDIFNSQD
jgi:hypothetical protein